MMDLGLLDGKHLVKLRDNEIEVNWSKRMKDAGKKARETRLRRQKSLQLKRKRAGIKAARTRKLREVENHPK
jgi:hypothetical protein